MATPLIERHDRIKDLQVLGDGGRATGKTSPDAHAIASTHPHTPRHCNGLNAGQ